MSVVAAPMVLFAVRLGKDALTEGAVIVDRETITIENGVILRRPITLGRADVAAVLVDPDGVANHLERLRFSLGDDNGFIYSSVTGSALPLVSGEPMFPNLAIVLSRPRRFCEPRRRFNGDVFAPLRPPKNAAEVPGLLLAVSDASRARQALDGWGDADAARAALGPWGGASVMPDGHRFGVVAVKPPAARRPLTSKRLRRLIVPTAALLAVGRASAWVSRREHLGTESNIALAVAFACVLAGDAIDRRRRYEEQSGNRRYAGLALIGIGFFVMLGLGATRVVGGPT